MDGWYIAAVVLSCINIALCLALFLMPKRSYALFVRFAFDIVAIMNAICIYMSVQDKVLLAIVASSSVSAIRDVIFMFREKRAWANSYAWIFLFSIILVVFSIIGWSSWLTLLPIIGTIINTIALYLTDYKKMKGVTIIGQIFFILYYCFLIPESDLLMALNLVISSVMLLSAIIGLLLYFVKARNPQNNE